MSLKAKHRLVLLAWFLGGSYFLLQIRREGVWYLLPLIFLIVGLYFYIRSVKCPQCDESIMYNSWSSVVRPSEPWKCWNCNRVLDE